MGHASGCHSSLPCTSSALCPRAERYWQFERPLRLHATSWLLGRISQGFDGHFLGSRLSFESTGSRGPFALLYKEAILLVLTGKWGITSTNCTFRLYSWLHLGSHCLYAAAFGQSQPRAGHGLCYGTSSTASLWGVLHWQSGMADHFCSNLGILPTISSGFCSRAIFFTRQTGHVGTRSIRYTEGDGFRSWISRYWSVAQLVVAGDAVAGTGHGTVSWFRISQMLWDSRSMTAAWLQSSKTYPYPAIWNFIVLNLWLLIVMMVTRAGRVWRGPEAAASISDVWGSCTIDWKHLETYRWLRQQLGEEPDVCEDLRRTWANLLCGLTFWFTRFDAQVSPAGIWCA